MATARPGTTKREAAADEMYEALKHLDTYWSTPADGYRTPNSKRSKMTLAAETLAIWKQIRAALKKAEGRQ